MSILMIVAYIYVIGVIIVAIIVGMVNDTSKQADFAYAIHLLRIFTWPIILLMMVGDILMMIITWIRR